jgi:hypothetical protein
MRKFAILLPSIVFGALFAALLTGTARAQDEAPTQAPQRVTHNAEWEYRDYHCTSTEVEGAYTQLNRLGEDGWEAYAYQSNSNGFNWELKRRTR